MRPFVRLILAAGFLLARPAASQHATNAPAFDAAAGDVRKFQLATGLAIEPWAAEPQLANPVAFSLAPAGTNGVAAYVAETHRMGVSVLDITQNTPWLLNDVSFRTVADRAAFLTDTAFATNAALLTRDSEFLRRVADTDGDARADRSEVFADGFNTPVDGLAAGVLAQGTNVWFANIPNLWRFSHQPETSEPHKLTADGQWLMATGFGVHIGVNGHDLHGLIRGPDGRIYLSFGDRGVCVTNREGVVINLPDTGGVLRCEPDGAGLEVFCIGLRNPQELAFDDFGNLFTVDNDTAGADPCRVLHLFEGGDYGWRASYQHMRGFGPWVQEGLWAGGLDGVLPPAGTVSQGPSGLAYYPGTGFGRFAGKFLHADFPGGVWAFSVKPHGASFAVADREKVLWNAWPTDVEFGPDGALYVLDWVAGWGTPGKGRIHRITESGEVTGDESQVTSREVYRLLSEGMTHRPEKELLELLGHPDRRVRLEAQWELGGRGISAFEGLAKVARKNASRLARLHAIWAIGQIERSVRWHFAEELAGLIPLLDDADEEFVAQVARLLSEARVSNALDRISGLASHPSPRVRFEGALGRARFRLEHHNERFQPPLRARVAQKLSRTYWEKTGRLAPQFLRTMEWLGRPTNRFASIRMLEFSAGADEFTLHAAAHIGRPDRAGSVEMQVLAHPQMPPVLRLLGVRAARVGANTLGTAPPQASDQFTFFGAFPLAGAEPAVGAAEMQEFLMDLEPWVALEAARAINDVPVPEAYPALAGLLGDGRGAQAPSPVAAGTPAAHPPAGAAANPGAIPLTIAPLASAGGAPADAPGADALLGPWLRIPDLTLAAYLEKSGTPWTGPLPLPTNVATLRWQFLKRVLNAHFRLGHATNAAALAGFALAAASEGRALASPASSSSEARGARPSEALPPTAARVEALFLLGAWEVLPAAPGRVPAEIKPDPNHGSTPTINPENWPGWFDRVVGLWRPLPARPPDDARDALTGVFAGLVAPEQPEPVQLAAVEAAGRLRAEAVAGSLADLVTAARPVAVRAAALRALAEAAAPRRGELREPRPEGSRSSPLRDEPTEARFTRALNAALTAPEPELRRTAISLLGDHAAPDTAAALGRFLATETDVALKQTALAALARLPGDEAADLLARQLDELIAGRMPAALRLDVALAAEARKSPALDAQLTRYRASLPADPVDALADVLAGGDAARGRAIFFEKAEVQCSRCHQVKGEGGIVGPALDGIARRLDRRGLLETIVHPNAQIAPGFENVLLTLADGRTLAGTVKQEDGQKLILATGEDGDVTVPKSAVTKRERTLSAMPEGQAELMTRRELRDLIEHLAALK